MAKCPFAIWMPLPWNAGNYVRAPFKIIHHTTEGSSADGAFATYADDHHFIPHFTVDEDKIYQHLDTALAARALAHPAGTGETNRSSAIQFELVGFAGKPKSRASLDNVGRLCRWLEKTHNIPPVWPNGLPNPPLNGADPGNHNRSEANWTTKGGHYGHCHVPHNNHWDPAYTRSEVDQIMNVQLTETLAEGQELPAMAGDAARPIAASAGTLPRGEKRTKGKFPQAIDSPAAPGSIRIWEDDPGTGVLARVPVPDPEGSPLAFAFPQPAPPPGDYEPGSAEFRYWTAVEALRRGADFWSSTISLSQWEPGDSLPVMLDEGEELNAFYDRQALNFFHGPSPAGVVFSGESPDILCHEMGHAVLDAIKPELFDVVSQEAAAFHEAFADISAILSGLQLKSFRDAVLHDTGGRLYRNSRLSRLAEQLGTAIRAQHPDSVDGDCLRNAVNSFVYQDPISLPSQAPASQISSEPHSFSRIFTGAAFEALAGILSAIAVDPDDPQDDELQTAAVQLAQTLVDGIRNASVVPNFYAQVAAAMIEASGARHPDFRGILRAIFVRRGILSFQSATAPQAAAPAVRMVSFAANGRGVPPPARMALPAAQYGLGDVALLVHGATQPRRFSAMAAATTFGEVNSQSSEVAARAFVDDIFQRGHVDYAGYGEKSLASTRSFKTHRLIATDGGVLLERRCFHCGLHHLR